MGNDQVSYIYNVYNLCQSSSDPSSLPLVRQIIDNAGLRSEQIIFGDFNLHHLNWGGVDI